MYGILVKTWSYHLTEEMLHLVFFSFSLFVFLFSD